MKECILSRRCSLKALVTVAFGAGPFLKGEVTDEVRGSTDQNDRNREGRSELSDGMIDATTLRELDVQPGDQIRVAAPDADPAYPCVLATVPDRVMEKDEWDCTDLCETLDVPTDTTLTVDPQVPHPEYETKREARENDEFVEELRAADSTELVVTAPHGGRIEYRTDHQARYVANELGVSEWSCYGHNRGGGALTRWHVTSTEINPRSFPKLAALAEETYDYAVSFHGFGEDGIAVGGGASTALKREVCAAIDEATDEQYDVYIPDDDSPYAGKCPENFVNWLTAENDGIQIESSLSARNDDWRAIAKGVVAAFD